MREIKFRAWDKQDKRMIVDKQDFIPLIVTNKSVFKLDPTSEEHRWIEIDTNRFELMQSTGLKDKNGVEIYEGDIVAYDLGFDDEKPENYKIVFDNKQCAYFMFPLNDKSRLRHFTYSAKNDCKVIGNIYENPELLN